MQIDDAPGSATAAPVRVAVILPCFNEGAAIGEVVKAFAGALPDAEIHVIDNASTDDTGAVAEREGAIVRAEPNKGKGNAVRRAFADIDADISVMADGDGTYHAQSAPAMIAMLCERTLDMVVGVRKASDALAYRPGHVAGNRIFTALFRGFFRYPLTDIFSGYRVFSRRFVKSFPSTSEGFEIELEMSTHAALLRLPVDEVDTVYGARAEGTESKLNTLRDGFRILRRMFHFLRLHRPRFVYGLIAAAGALFSAILAAPVILEYFATGLVPRFPTLIVAAAAMIAAFVVFAIGVILDAQARYFAETKRLAYLAAPPPPRSAGG